MKRIVFSLIVVIVALASACNQSSKNNSQQNSGPGDFDAEERVNSQLEELNEVLNFSGNQEEQVGKVLMESMDNMMRMREEMQNSGGGFEGMREKMQEVRTEQNKKIKEILSEEQWVKYEVYEKERRGKRGQGRSGGGQGRPQ